MELKRELTCSRSMEIRIASYPQLNLLCWNRPEGTVLDGAEALALYDRNWRFVDADALEQTELDLISLLTQKYGNGVFLAA